MPSLSTNRRTFFEKGAVAVGPASLGGSLLEVGGTSLHPTLAQKVTNLELLRILAEHRPQRNQAFETWQDQAGNGSARHRYRHWFPAGRPARQFHSQTSPRPKEKPTSSLSICRSPAISWTLLWVRWPSFVRPQPSSAQWRL